MIRLGVIGHGGRMSGMIKSPFRLAALDLRVTGIVDSDERSARERLDDADKGGVVFYSLLSEMVRKGKLDGLAIGTRCNTHAAYAAEAARYDLPLFLEKPVAISMAQTGGLSHFYGLFA